MGHNNKWHRNYCYKGTYSNKCIKYDYLLHNINLAAKGNATQNHDTYLTFKEWNNKVFGSLLIIKSKYSLLSRVILPFYCSNVFCPPLDWNMAVSSIQTHYGDQGLQSSFLYHKAGLGKCQYARFWIQSEKQVIMSYFIRYVLTFVEDSTLIFHWSHC